ncbi:TPA_exp: NACHT and WD domain protein [Trichophyton benhamiae CBS 112371]|nr:TPA_exp: NACHT and WD domain protein [Trichophyton benhamiae CBS 112371]
MAFCPRPLSAIRYLIEKLWLHKSRQKKTNKEKDIPHEARPLSRPDSPPPDTKVPGKELLNSHAPVTTTSESTRANKRDPSDIDPLGLTLIHRPADAHVDIIFVHGLGGSSLRTWSYERDVKNLWLPWLGDEEGLSNARIFTFGYDANYAQSAAPLSILDFAKTLLFNMKGYHDEGREDGKAIGDLPLIFVAHSMGGLVVKKAYIMGKLDQCYSPIISKTHGMLFLGTPHRGSNFASTLNTILRLAPTIGTKLYVSELDRNSLSIVDINEHFRYVCSDLDLVSFYETLHTIIPPGIKAMVVKKESAVLGYPQEMATALIADHNRISKYRSRDDANYKSVKDALRNIVQRAIAKGHSNTAAKPPTPILSSMKSIFGIQNMGEDPGTAHEQILPGSCGWILEKEWFRDWVADITVDLSVLWLTGLPGSGKTTLSSFLVHNLGERNATISCQYYFFGAGQREAHTTAHFLRSIAFQIAETQNDFRSRLIDLHQQTGAVFDSWNHATIWEKIFEGILFQAKLDQSLIWILDGVDEAESPTAIVKFVSKIRTLTPTRVLLVSRETEELAMAMTVDGCRIHHKEIQIDDTAKDIQLFVSHSLRNTLLDEKSRTYITDKIISDASGSFLWVKLVMEHIKNSWHTDIDLKKALNTIPEDMQRMYERMVDTISDQPQNRIYIVAEILTWVLCASIPLNIKELAEALKARFGNFTDLRTTINLICGGFITVTNSTVTVIHETAREFLISGRTNSPISIDIQQGHMRIARVCMEYLSHSKWKTELAAIHETREPDAGNPYFDVPFLSYAVTYWAYHVHNSEEPGLQLDVLEFLSQSALVWVYAVSLTRNLQAIVYSAQYLRVYAEKLEQRMTQTSSIDSNASRTQELIQWSNALIRLVGHFGSHIIEAPSAIYRQTIPFFNHASILAREFQHLGQNSIQILGISPRNWEDCLARVTMGYNETAAKVVCKDRFFITLLDSSGTLVVWDAVTCLETMRLYHGEWITSIKAAKARNLLASAGIHSIRIWDINQGTEICSIPRASESIVISLAFRSNDTELLYADDSFTIKCIDLDSREEKQILEAISTSESEYGPPRGIVFSPDSRRVAVVHPRRPLQIWRINHGKNPKQFIRKKAINKHNWGGKDIINSPGKIVWRPDSSGILALYPGMLLIDWNVDDDTQTEYSHIIAHEMVLSLDGKWLLTSDHNDLLSIWSTDSFRLIYQLKYEGIVRDVSFSPDSRRIYDIRDTICNIWEPPVLQLLDNCERRHISSEMMALPRNGDRVPVTALICGNDLPYYCAGREDGSVIMYEARSAKRLRKLYGHSNTASVVLIVWSLSQRYIASADDEGRVIAKRLRPPTAQAPQKWAVYGLIDLQQSGPVSQLLFSISEEFLLVSSQESDEVWSTKSKEKLWHVNHEKKTQHRRWMNHPRDSDLLVCIERGEQHLYTWNGLGMISLGRRHMSSMKRGDDSLEDNNNDEYSNIGFNDPNEPLVALETLGNVFQIGYRYFVIEMVLTHGFNPNARFHSNLPRRLEVIDFGCTQPQRRGLIQLSSQIRWLVGIIQRQLVFFNHQYWLCTWEFDTDENSYQKHFFLPRNWIFPETLDLARVDQFGNLLCPMDGEIAVIQSGIRI